MCSVGGYVSKSGNVEYKGSVRESVCVEHEGT